MAISIPRREDFTSEEIFNNLFFQEKVKGIYPNPKTEVERNTNNKYSRLDWMTDILASSLGSSSNNLLG